MTFLVLRKESQGQRTAFRVLRVVDDHFYKPRRSTVDPNSRDIYIFR
jgi:hypothetical protein